MTILLFLVVNALLAGAALIFALSNRSGQIKTAAIGPGSPGRSEFPSQTVPGAVTALGRVQPTGGLIGIFGIPGERITAWDVAAGSTVQAGQRLGSYSGEPERDLNLDLLKKQIAEAEQLRAAITRSGEAKLADINAEAKQAQAGLDEDKATIDAKVRGAQARKANALGEQRRLSDAQKAGVKVSDQERDQLQLIVELAEAEMQGANAQLRKIDAQRAVAQESIQAKRASVEAETQRGLAQVPLESLKATLALAEAKKLQGMLRAPVSGKLVKIAAVVGETVSTLPIAQIADTNKMSILAEVYETDVSKLREWLKSGPIKVEAETRAILGKTDSPPLTGTVRKAEQISTVIAKNVMTPLGPREDADRRVVEVQVELDPGQGIENYIGVQLQTRFLPPGGK
jgi:HlyD family secretion protein